jgi:hypothetical protein
MVYNATPAAGRLLTDTSDEPSIPWQCCALEKVQLIALFEPSVDLHTGGVLVNSSTNGLLKFSFTVT